MQLKRIQVEKKKNVNANKNYYKHCAIEVVLNLTYILYVALEDHDDQHGYFLCSFFQFLFHVDSYNIVIQHSSFEIISKFHIYTDIHVNYTSIDPKYLAFLVEFHMWKQNKPFESNEFKRNRNEKKKHNSNKEPKHIWFWKTKTFSAAQIAVVFLLSFLFLYLLLFLLFNN